ncbi:unnamed protein product [Haemonchus placei]|uniref:Uncharacterized protein n=1 Tax=Haemonchus placei TaxID=6290 RepID=A0A3P7UWL5_HAEPC|nr:unnamed protein product [Haemonchus placei]
MSPDRFSPRPSNHSIQGRKGFQEFFARKTSTRSFPSFQIC